MRERIARICGEWRHLDVKRCRKSLAQREWEKRSATQSAIIPLTSVVPKLTLLGTEALPMSKPLTVQQFFTLFPDDDTCLDHLFRTRFGEQVLCPKCHRISKFYRLASEQAYSCPWCGHHVHPMVGTPFEKTHTSLQRWYYAMYLFTTTRHGVSAKELQRQFGCSYKTAWRMGHEIRKYMAVLDGDDEKLDGNVEVDETYVGGKRPPSS